MTFAEKLKNLRHTNGISQEELAEKLHVSRQAVTKWETANGLPDIENITGIASLFAVSIDELLSEEKSLVSKQGFLYESRTEYDLNEEKHLDIKLGAAKEIIVERTNDEKIQIVVSSNKLVHIAQQVKVKIKETERRMDIEAVHASDLTDSQAKEHLFFTMRIPAKFVADMEMNAVADSLLVHDIQFDYLEYSGKLNSLCAKNASGHIELDCSCDIHAKAEQFSGKIDFNQIRAVSHLELEAGCAFHAKRVGSFFGKHNRIFFAENGTIVSELDSKRNPKDADNATAECVPLLVESAGFMSELIINEIKHD